MKKLLIVLLFVLQFVNTYSQNGANYFSASLSTIYPASATYSPKIKIEHKFKNVGGAGINSRLYWDKVNRGSYVAEPFLKLYMPQGENKSNFYLQVSAYSGRINHEFQYQADANSLNGVGALISDPNPVTLFLAIIDIGSPNKIYTYQTHSLTITGMGMSIGFVNTFGKNNNFFIDCNTGFKYCKVKDAVPESVIENGNEYILNNEKRNSIVSKKNPFAFRNTPMGSYYSRYVGFGFIF